MKKNYDKDDLYYVEGYLHGDKAVIAKCVNRNANVLKSIIERLEKVEKHIEEKR